MTTLPINRITISESDNLIFICKTFYDMIPDYVGRCSVPHNIKYSVFRYLTAYQGWEDLYPSTTGQRAELCGINRHFIDRVVFKYNNDNI
jgi:hypothetical protein